MWKVMKRQNGNVQVLKERLSLDEARALVIETKSMSDMQQRADVAVWVAPDRVDF